MLPRAPYYIASRVLPVERFRARFLARFLAIVRNHWRIENSLHWVLDVTFKEDNSRLRKGHGAANMVGVRHFALNLARALNDKRSIKRRRKRTAWDDASLTQILGLNRRLPGLVALAG